MGTPAPKDGKKPDYQAIGEMLRDTRESYDITPEQAAYDLHIKANHIHALELGNLEAIPGMTYAKGYLRAYAQYLGINLNTMLSLVSAESELKPMASLNTAKTEPMRVQMAVTISFLLLVIGGGVWYFVASPQEERRVQLVKPVPEDMLSYSARQQRISVAEQVANACAEGKDALYPPCYQEIERNRLAAGRVSGALRTVMETASTDITVPLY